MGTAGLATNGSVMGKPTEPKPQYLLFLLPPYFLGCDWLSFDNSEIRRKQKRKNQNNWVVKIVILTFAISVVLSALSGSVLEGSAPIFMIVALLVIVFIGVLFDVIGVAVTAADEAPFHAMAAKKRSDAKIAISLLKNADKVSNFCNDVIGDICGIVSGAAASAIILQIPTNHFFWNLLLSGLTAALTVGGKAIGKSVALSQSENIVFQTARLILFFKRLLRIKG